MTNFNPSTALGTQSGKTHFIMVTSIVALTCGLIAFFFYSSTLKEEGSATDIATRTEPIGELSVGAKKIAETAMPKSSVAIDGTAVYNSSCVACHGTGVAGAPKLGDSDAWKERIAKGSETLYTNAIFGFQGTGFMPARGGNASLSDDQVKAAVDHMIAATK